MRLLRPAAPVLVAASSALLLFATAQASPLFEAGALPVVSGSPMVQPTLDRGLAALKNGDLGEAAAAFLAARNLAPDLPQAYLGLAEVAGRQGKDGEVDNWLREGLAHSPRNVELLRTLGRWQALKGRWSEAETAFQQAIKINPGSSDLHSALGEVYLHRKETLTKAEQEFRGAMKLDGRSVTAQVGLARALAGLGKGTEAQKALEAVVKANPGDPRPLHALSRLSAAQGKIDEAITFSGKTIDVASDYLPAYLDQGDLYMAKGMAEKAASVYLAATLSCQDTAPAFFRLGVAQQALQKWPEAERSYLNAVKRQPALFGAYNNLAFMAAERKANLDQGLQWALKAKELAPGQATVLDTLGWIYRARGDLRLATTTLEDARAKQPKNASVRYHLGVVYGESGRKTEAKVELEQFLAINPRHRNASDASQRLKTLSGR